MKSHYHKILASLTLASALICFLGNPPSAQANGVNGGNGGTSVPVPDGGASLVLLVLGGSGLAIAARKRFKR